LAFFMVELRWGSELDHDPAVLLAVTASVSREPEVLAQVRADVAQEIVKPGRLLLAEQDEDLVGMGRWKLAEPDLGHINMVNVHPAHRRQGIAREVIRGLVADARAAGMARARLYVRIGNQGAIDLYDSEGFSLVHDGRDWGNDPHLVMYAHL
jgi:ribosomal protein S18 acetylase RimI-like enzyme